MKAVLEINLNELNENLLEMVRSMFQKNITEIVLKPQIISLEEFDKSLSVNEVTRSLKDTEHNTDFITEIKYGLENASIYSRN